MGVEKSSRDIQVGPQLLDVSTLTSLISGDIDLMTRKNLDL